MKELGKNKLCGCGSGREYKNCCYNKDFVYMVDENGEIYRQIKLSKETSKLLKTHLDNQKKEFRDIFDRDMSGEDPIFFQDKYLKSSIEVREEIIMVMKRANIKPEFIYAFIKTDRLVGEDNIDKLPDKDLNEWKAAIDEYHNRVKKGENPLDDKPPKEIADLLDEFPKCIYIIAHVLANDKFLILNNEDKDIFPLLSCIIFSLKKVEKNLKSISQLLEYPDTTGDALNISRSIYEIYLSIQYTIKYPEKVDSVFQDKLNKNKHMKKIKRISKKQMANESNYNEDKLIHDYIYSFLSRYPHPDLRTMVNYFEFEKVAHITSLEASTISLIYSSFILYEILKIDKIGERARTDIILFLKRIKKKLLKFYDKYPTAFNGKDYTDLIKFRISKLIL